MALANPTFSDAGDAPGTARSWLLRSHVAREAIASFDARGEDGFELWRALVEEIPDEVRSRAFFFDAGAEAFELGWLRFRFLRELDASMSVAAVLDRDRADAFEWSAHVEEWTAALSGAAALDAFDADWEGTSTYEPWFDAHPSARTTFAAGAVAEGFAGDWPPLGRS